MPNDDLDKIAKAFSSPSIQSKKNTSKGLKSSNSNTKKKKTASNGKVYWGKNYYKNPDLKSTSSKSSISNNFEKSINKTIDKSISNTISNNSSNSASNIVTKQIRKLPLISKICIVLLFIIGVAIGIGICLFICRNDKFEIVGRKNITLNIGESYTDEGVIAMGFGKDMLDKVTIEVYKNNTKINTDPSNLDTSSECIYQIKYYINNFRYRNTQIIRTINIVSPNYMGTEIDLFGTALDSLENLIGNGLENESEIEHIFISNDNTLYVLKKDSNYTPEQIPNFCDYNCFCEVGSEDYTKLVDIVNTYNNNKNSNNASWITVTITEIG